MENAMNIDIDQIMQDIDDIFPPAHAGFIPFPFLHAPEHPAPLALPPQPLPVIAPAAVEAVGAVPAAAAVAIVDQSDDDDDGDDDSTVMMTTDEDESEDEGIVRRPRVIGPTVSLERRTILVQMIQAGRAATIKEACDALGINYSTGRRIWRKFQQDGILVVKQRGGRFRV